jgi:hypothetical protein
MGEIWRVQGLVLVDGEEMVSISVEVNTAEAAHTLATEMGAGITRGLVEAHRKLLGGEEGVPEEI